MLCNEVLCIFYIRLVVTPVNMDNEQIGILVSCDLGAASESIYESLRILWEYWRVWSKKFDILPL